MINEQLSLDLREAQDGCLEFVFRGQQDFSWTTRGENPELLYHFGPFSIETLQVVCQFLRTTLATAESKLVQLQVVQAAGREE